MGDVLVDNKKLYNFELKFITFLSIINFISITLFIIGFFQVQPNVILKFNIFFKIILALFLIYRFNDYRKQPIRFTELDRKICFSTGVFIIIISFIDIITYNIEFIRKNYILPYTEPVLNYSKKILKNLNLSASL
jgi:hypothetical protein